MRVRELCRSRLPYGCVYFDASFADLLLYYRSLMQPDLWDRREHLEADVLRHFGVGLDQGIVTLSARSALDLLLSVHRFPVGSHVLMSAINIPDMVRIIETHGLIPIPIDLDIDTLAPDIEQLKSAVSFRTVAVLIAHIYGRVNALDEIVEVSREHGLLLIEDCAECFSGTRGSDCYLGNPRSDAVLFSFGAIKPCTAFGGGVALIRDKSICVEMRRIHCFRPVRAKKDCLDRILKYSLVMFFLNQPVLIDKIINVLHFLDIEHRELTVSLLRGFPDRFLARLRQRPEAALLFLLSRRLDSYDSEHKKKTLIVSERMAELLPGECQIPGKLTKKTGAWLFPILVESPDVIVEQMSLEGIDVYRGATQLGDVPVPVCIKDVPVPKNAKYILNHVVYLPVHKHVPLQALEVIAQSLDKAVQRSSRTSRL